MHGRYNRRRPHAERDFIRMRQTPTANVDDGGSDDDTGDLSGPITITVIETVPFSTSASSTMWTTSTAFSTILGVPTLPSTTSSTTSSTISTTSSTTSSTLTTSSTSISTSTSTTSSLLSSTTPLSSTLSLSATPSSTTVAHPQANLASAKPLLSAGGIAGILISILALLAAVVIVFLRRRFIRKRKQTTSAWTRRSMALGPAGADFERYSEPKSFNPVSTSDDATAPSPISERDEGRIGNLTVRNTTIEDIAPPPMAFNSPTLSSIIPVGVPARYSANSLVNSSSSTVVVCTFITTLPDELAITIGESIRVLAEYDDGWALCMNTTGEQGMVPLECLNRGTPVANAELQVDTRNSRRISSLDANGLSALAYRR